MNQSTQNLKKVAVWHPYFLGGGAESVSLWILEALASHYNVTLFTLNSPDLQRLDILYNTHLSQQKNLTVQRMLPPSWSPTWVDRLIANSPKMKEALNHWAVRAFKSMNTEYDLVFSTYNALDMGQIGIQYLHWVHVVDPQPKKIKGGLV